MRACMQKQKQTLETFCSFVEGAASTLELTCPGNTARVVCSVQPTQSPWLQTSSPAASPPAASHHYHYSAETEESREGEVMMQNLAASIGQMHKSFTPTSLATFPQRTKEAACLVASPCLEQVAKQRK